MASGTSGNSSKLCLPSCLPFYEKTLPDVSPLYGNPMFSASTDMSNMHNVGVDSAGNYDEPKSPTYGIDSYQHDFMNPWGTNNDSSLTIAVDNLIQECCNEADKENKSGNAKIRKEPELLETNKHIDDKGNDGVDDSRNLQPPGTDSTPMNQRPPLHSLDNAPSRPFTHLPRFYQRPRTLFEMRLKKNIAEKPYKPNNADQKSDWEIFHHIDNEKYVTVSKFKGRKSIHIRQWYMNKNNKSCPSQKGIVLTPVEWENLTKNMENVDKILQERS